jgi:cytochrome P450
MILTYHITKNVFAVVRRSIAVRGTSKEDRNMIQQFLDAELPEELKSFWRLSRECASIITAGTETTGTILAFITFYLLSNRPKLQKLQQELSKAEADSGGIPSVQGLRELPYLVSSHGTLSFAYSKLAGFLTILQTGIIYEAFRYR